MYISFNTASVNSNRYLELHNAKLDQSVAKLSTGLRINKASDDASGFLVSEKMKSDTNISSVLSRNCQDAISLIQIAESSLTSISEMLNRLRSIVTQAANEVYASSDIENLQEETNDIILALDDIATSTAFNGLRLLSGDYSHPNSIRFQIGAFPNEAMNVSIRNCHSSQIGVISSNKSVKSVFDINLSTTENRSESLAVIDKAINDIVLERASLGAYSNRAEFTMNSLVSSNENMVATQSRIADLDLATEIANHSRLTLMVQSGIAILSQSNQHTQSILQLIK